jgi:hypothetical protein
VPIAPYDPRNTDDPKDIEYRVEYHTTEHNEDVQLKHSILDETYNHRIGVERTVQSRTAASGANVSETVHARTEVYVALGLRLIGAQHTLSITNYERGNNPSCGKL